MPRLDEIVYDVREAINAFSDDTEVSDRYIIYLYNTKRAKYLRQDLNNYQKTVDNSILQTLCLGLELVSIDECDNDDCLTILRTKQPIPTPLELHTKVAITKVKPTNRISKAFNFITKDKMQFIEGATFGNAIYAFLDDDNYIYVHSNQEGYKLLECITITGVFEDPLELSNYSNCCNCGTVNNCFDEMTSNYPLQPHYVDLIREEIVQLLLRKLQIPEDKTNDSTD